MKNSSKIIWAIALIVIVVLIGVLVFGYYKKINLKIANPVATMEVEKFWNNKIRTLSRPSTTNSIKFYSSCK